MRTSSISVALLVSLSLDQNSRLLAIRAIFAFKALAAYSFKDGKHEQEDSIDLRFSPEVASMKERFSPWLRMTC